MKRILLAVVVIVVMSSGSLAGGQKSLSKAMLLSLAMPGAGELYLGYGGRAKAMLASEAAVWCAFAGFRIQGNMRKERYKELAKLFAGVEGSRDDDYYRLLSLYISSEDYNIDVMREARQRYPNDRAKQLEYFEANGYFGDDSWQWDSLAHMDEFEMTRTRSREAYRRAVLTTGFTVLNRVVSVLDVYLSFKLDRGQDNRGISLNFRQVSPNRFTCYLSKSF